VLGAQITGGSWSTMMNFEAMSRAGAAGRIALPEAATAMMGLPPYFKDQLVVRDSVISHPGSKKSVTFADVVRSCKATKTFTPDGTQVHPDNIRAQVEGAALWGLSLALYEKATLANGAIEQTNFDSYTPLRMSQMPEVAVAVIANGEHATGVGEPAVTVIAPAIGNAVYNASGARVRGLPITAEAVKAAMKA
jgi:CO/xanthine dehydrogenase Mo-binding subunit